MVWALVIAGVVLLFAVLIHTWVFQVAEADGAFFGAVGGFLVLFVVSAILLVWLLPGLNGRSDVNGLVGAWLNNGAIAAPSGASALPLYGKN
jgi:hypothetical protein